MNMLLRSLIFFVLEVQYQNIKATGSFRGKVTVLELMCFGTDDVVGRYELDRPPEEENQYDTKIHGNFKSNSFIEIKLDDDGSIKLIDKSYARVDYFENRFRIFFFRDHNDISFVVKGLKLGKIPYFNSIVVNGIEVCSDPMKGIFDSNVKGFSDYAISKRYNDQNITRGNDCGQRKIEHTELIVNGMKTKPGDWPWHVAIYRLEQQSVKYICAGTLVSKFHVITAAHCVTIRENKVSPDTLNVVLGKYNMIGRDTTCEERQVQNIIVHEQFERRYLDNDIALLKLRSEVSFTDYIQPACLWKEETSSALPPGEVYGTIVGWGFSQTGTFSNQLQIAVLPILPDMTCVMSNYAFYGRVLNGKKFCAGYQNGTSPCNGDSGGGMTVFIPDSADGNPKPSGGWYLRGIISMTVSQIYVPLCDPQQNAVFTDTSVYIEWINRNMQ